MFGKKKENPITDNTVAVKEERPAAASKAVRTLRPGSFFKLVLYAAMIALIACGILVFIFDPFYHYHAPWFNMKAVLNEKEYQVPGTLRNFEYDAVLAGSSVVECADNGDLDNAFGCTVVKAVRSYGGTADLCWFLEEAHKAREIRQVFYNIDPSALQGEAQTTFKSVGCPMYLYDRNPFNDVKYLFNRDVLFKRIPYEIARSRTPGYDEKKSYSWAEGKDFSEAAVLSHYMRTPSVARMQAESMWDAQCQASIALLEKEITSHPETYYRFFFPPYSMLWWDNAIRTGERDAVLRNELRVMQALNMYQNVEIYCFQGVEDVICDLDNYMDTIHFTPAINAWMVKEMAARSRLVQPGDEEAIVNSIRRLTDSLQEKYLKEIGEAGRFVYDIQ